MMNIHQCCHKIIIVSGETVVVFLPQIYFPCVSVSIEPTRLKKNVVVAILIIVPITVHIIIIDNDITKPIIHQHRIFGSVCK